MRSYYVSVQRVRMVRFEGAMRAVVEIIVGDAIMTPHVERLVSPVLHPRAAFGAGTTGLGVGFHVVFQSHHGAHDFGANVAFE